MGCFCSKKTKIHSLPNYNRKTIHDFKLYAEIGSGAYCKVYLATENNNEDSRIFAIKVVDVWRLTQNHVNRERFLKDILCEKDIIEDIHVFKDPFLVNHYYSFMDCRYMYFVMENYKYDLRRLLSNVKKNLFLTENEIVFAAAEIYQGLINLHKMNIYHRDLKPGNIMITESGGLKICDFNHSKRVGMVSERTDSFCVGTYRFRAPEIFESEFEEGGYHHAVDLFSYGLVVLELLSSGVHPYDDIPELKEVWEKGRKERNISLLLEVSKNVHKFIDQFAYRNGLSGHGIDLVKRLLDPNPLTRFGAVDGEKGIRDVKQHIFFKRINWVLMKKRRLPGALRQFNIRLDEYMELKDRKKKERKKKRKKEEEEEEEEEGEDEEEEEEEVIEATEVESVGEDNLNGR